MCRQEKMKKALFLDRDGVINKDYGYVHSKENFDFNDEIFEICARALECKYLIFIITNQAGIGRGMYSEEEFKKLNSWMLKEFRRKGIGIVEVYYCPHHPIHGIGAYKIECNCRKPKPGLINAASKRYDIDKKNSLFVGDKESDRKAAEAAGLGRCIITLDNLKDRKAEIMGALEK